MDENSISRTADFLKWLKRWQERDSETEKSVSLSQCIDALDCFYNAIVELQSNNIKLENEKIQLEKHIYSLLENQIHSLHVEIDKIKTGIKNF